MCPAFRLDIALPHLLELIHLERDRGGPLLKSLTEALP